MRLPWGQTELASATRFEAKWEKRFELCCLNEFANNNRAKSIGLDEHMQISSVIGLLDQQRGATIIVT